MRHERSTLIHVAAAELLSSETLHPSIIMTGWLNPVATVGGDAGGRRSVGATATKAAPVTKFRRSIIMPPLLRDYSLDVLAMRIA
jgi:hypothetical protein